MSDQIAPPGHQDAVAIGCTCPIIDNHRGAGSGWTNTDGSPAYWYDDACPVHGGKNCRAERLE